MDYEIPAFSVILPTHTPQSNDSPSGIYISCGRKYFSGSFNYVRICNRVSFESAFAINTISITLTDMLIYIFFTRKKTGFPTSPMSNYSVFGVPNPWKNSISSPTGPIQNAIRN